MSPQRGRPSGSAVRNRLPGGIPSRRQEEPRGLDLHHMLSAVVGAYVGLVFYSLITPGQIPHEPPLPSPDPRSALTIGKLQVHPGAGGLLTVGGQLRNGRDKPCRLANVTVRFLDREGRELTHTSTTVEQVPAHGSKAFEVRAMAIGAVNFEATPDLAQF